MKSTSHGTLEVAHEVRQEEHGAFEHAHEQQRPPLVVPRDLLAERLDPVRQVVSLDEHLSDGRVLHPRHWSRARREADVGLGVTRSAAKRSSSATPATQTIRTPPPPPAATRRSARGTLRSVNRSWRVLVPPRPTGRIRSPSRQERTDNAPPSAAAETSTSPARPGRASTSQSPNRALPGTGERRPGRAGAGSGPRGSAACRTRRSPAGRPEVERAAAARAAERQDGVHLAAREGAGPAGRPLGELPQHQTRQRGWQPARPRELHGRPAAERLERTRYGGVEHLGLVAQQPRRLGDRVLGRGAQLAQRRQQVVPHARAREAAVLVRRVLAPARARARGSTPRVSSRVTASSGRTSLPRRGSMPRSARRPGETASR